VDLKSVPEGANTVAGDVQGFTPFRERSHVGLEYGAAASPLRRRLNRPTSIFVTAWPGERYGRNLPFHPLAFAAGPRKNAAIVLDRGSISPRRIPEELLLRTTKPDSSAACAELIVGCPANGSPAVA
jgi:hypothetical protein